MPVYNTSGERAQIDLTKAAYEIQAMLITLAQGQSVNAAITAGNQAAAALNAAHAWKVVPQEAGNVKIR